MWEDPRRRQWLLLAAHISGGFLLSAASLGNACSPIAMGLICVVTGWRALAMGFGAALGYRLFWGAAGIQGMVWALLGTLTALFLGKRKIVAESPLLLPALAAAFVSASGLGFQILAADGTPVGIYVLRVVTAACSVFLWKRVLTRRDAITDWIAGGVAVLALAQVAPVPWLSLGYVAAGAATVSAAFPAAILAGLGLDLAQITPVPMAAVLCLGWLSRMLPPNRLRFLYPAAACVTVMGLCGSWTLLPLPGLLLGGGIGLLLPGRPERLRRRGETGLAQVRLELMSGVLLKTRQLLLEESAPAVDEDALMGKVRIRACGSCPNRKVCREQENLTPELLHLHLVDTASLGFACKKPGRLLLELRRGQEQLRQLHADRDRRQEYRSAVAQQYRFLSDFLQQLADQLPQRGSTRPHFRIEASARTAGKETDNGDRCLAFPGVGCKYYILLCDGMGTGFGAAQEGRSAASVLQQMLSAGFPADHALRSLNSILTLRGKAGAVTVDLAEACLDSGRINLYKWGAAPSWRLAGGVAEKIGTVSPPPGLHVTEATETVTRLSLRRGETLVMLSDGVDGERVLRRGEGPSQLPPGELAAWLLERGRGDGQDDATAAVIRLHLLRPST